MSDEELEEFVPEEESEQGPALVKSLREKLKKATEEKQKNLEGWQRAQADFVNYKREEAALAESKSEKIKTDFVESLLPALDSLELALKHAQTKEMNLVHKQLLDALRASGVEFYGKVGEAFDPHRHEALQQVPVESEAQDDTIVSVERSGYSIGNKIIRAAQVTVGAYNKK